MVKKNIQDLTSSYDVDLKWDRPNEESLMVSIRDKIERLELQIHFVSERIYAVRFLNNEFFEIPDENLWLVAREILHGNYEIKKGLFSSKKWIRVRLDDKNYATPEITYSYKEVEGVDDYSYEHLPKQFTLAN